MEAAGVLEPGEQFDAISIQFALHYLFQTEARALNFFRNIAGRLAPGGVFLGTIPDAAVLVRRLRDLDADERGFGNSHYSVEFTEAAKRAQWGMGDHPYGVKYTFFLTESVDHIDEYLVPWELLQRLAAAVGLRPLAKENFHAWFEKKTGMNLGPIGYDGVTGLVSHSAPSSSSSSSGARSGSVSDPASRREAKDLLVRMGVLDAEGALSKEEWEVAGLYRVFAFQAPMPGEPAPETSAHISRSGGAGAGAGSGSGPGTGSSGSVRVPPGWTYKSHIEQHDIVDLIKG